VRTTLKTNSMLAFWGSREREETVNDSISTRDNAEMVIWWDWRPLHSASHRMKWFSWSVLYCHVHRLDTAFQACHVSNVIKFSQSCTTMLSRRILNWTTSKLIGSTDRGAVLCCLLADNFWCWETRCGLKTVLINLTECIVVVNQQGTTGECIQWIASNSPLDKRFSYCW
jgi:hypothetical protein